MRLHMDIYLEVCQRRQPSHLCSLSPLEAFYKHGPDLRRLYDLFLSLLPKTFQEPESVSFISKLSECFCPLVMLRAHELSRQPRSELWLKEFLLLFGSGPGCLHSTAGEAPYCLDKLPNTQPGGCPITHPGKMCLCHCCFVHSSPNLI